MNRKYFLSFLIIPLLILSFEGYLYQASGKDERGENVRNSILSGTWYPGSRDALTKGIEDYLSKAKPVSLEGELKAIIVPHAGYLYSGQVAAHAYKLLRKMNFKRVIMIGPSHRVGFEGVSINLQSGYKTPLGVAPVDRVIARKIIDTSPHIRWLPEAHAREHSLEIQLPFLQTVIKDFQIVPILMGQQDFRTCSELAEGLVQVMGTMDRTLLVASSDLSHFHSYKSARKLDMELIKHVREFDPEGLAGSLSSGRCEACGGGPIIVAMLAAQKLGANRAAILNYANSGDVTGDHSRVVGYLSVALIKGN